MNGGRAIRSFKTAEATFETFRSTGRGRQDICTWVGPGDGAPYQAGIAELRHIRIADYTFAFDDFLYVLEGGVTITQEGRATTLGPGEAVFIPRGATVTLEIPDRLVWTFVAHADGADWAQLAGEPGAVEELLPGP